MANEQTTGSPLTAQLGEQLEEKERLEAEHAAEREAGEVIERRVERKKAEEREAAVRHASPDGEQPISTEEAARRVRRAGREAGMPRAAPWPGWGRLLRVAAVFGALVAIGKLLRR